MTSLAEEFFKRIVEGDPSPVSFLKGLVNSTPPTFEQEWREFKGMPHNDDDLKECWSKSLSAFANTEGGVLVWGIDARPDPTTKVDAACGLKLILDTGRHKSRLLQLLHEATDPPLTGVRIEEYPDNCHNGSGFVVCLIPESDQKPVRSELVKHKPYYIRSGESSTIINRSLLRSLFYPQTRSRLAFTLLYSSQLVDGGTRHGEFTVSMHNDGPSTASDLVIVLKYHPHDAFPRCRYMTPNGYIGHPEPVSHALLDAVHPGMARRLFEMGTNDVSHINDEIQITLYIYARDREAKTVVMSYPLHKLRVGRDEMTFQA